MPIEKQDSIMKSPLVVEDRKIKIGEKGANAPKKLKAPKVTHARKSRGGSNFDEDIPLMAKIREFLGIEAKADLTEGVPVRLLSDKIEDIVYIYRALYNGAGVALCKSNLGDAEATRWFSPEPLGPDKGKQVGKAFILNEPVKVDCNQKCPYWAKSRAEKSPCTWHAVVTTQLEQRPSFPEPTRFRTSGETVIKHLVGSLNKISAVTGGVLANIPLMFKEAEIDGKDGEGQRRSWPVVYFASRPGRGQLHILRDDAVAELESRRRLKAALEGKMVNDPSVHVGVHELDAGAMISGVADDIGGPQSVDDPDDFVSFDDEGTSVPALAGAASPTKDEAAERLADQLSAEVRELCVKSQTSDRALEAIIEKHAGDLGKVRDELRKLLGTGGAAPAGSAAANTAAGDDDDGWDMGGASNEASETPDKVEPEEEKKAAAETEKAKEEKAAEPVKPVGDDDFTLFEDDES